MKNRRMRLMAIFAAGVLSVTSMGGIVTAHAEETLSVPAEEAGAGAVQMDGKDAQAAEDGSVAASEGLIDRKSTRLNSSHTQKSRMPSSA